MSYQNKLQEARTLHLRASQLEEEAGKEKLEEIKTDKTMKAWLNVEFRSSSTLTEEFALFARQFKVYLKRQLPAELELADFSRGHFYISGFVKNTTTGKLAYFSTSDVRYFSNAWYNNLLVRTAKHVKDFTGGSNDWSTLDNINKKVLELTAEDYPF